MDGIFISYRRDDAAGYAGRLYDRLAAHFGPQRVFMDVEGIEPGTDFIDAIEAAVGSCRVLIVMIGDHWIDAADGSGKRRLEDPFDFVRIETAMALKRNVRVVPVLLDGAPMPRVDQLPEDLVPLIRRQAIDISHKQWEASTGELIRTLERIFTPLTPEDESAATGDKPAGATGGETPQTPATGAGGNGTPQPTPLRRLLLPGLALAALVGGIALFFNGAPRPTAPHVIAVAPQPTPTPTPTPSPSPSPEPSTSTHAATPPSVPPPSPAPPPAPSASVTSNVAQLDFGAQGVGSSTRGSLRLTNTGNATAKLGKPRLEGSAAGDFAIVSNTCGASLPPARHCDMTIAFRPPAHGTRSAQLAVRPAGDGDALSIALLGNGVATPRAPEPQPAPPPRAALPAPQIRVLTTRTEGAQVSVCYVVSDATSVSLAPQPGRLDKADRDCVPLTIEHPASYTLTARNADGMAQKTIALAPPVLSHPAPAPEPAHDAFLPEKGERWIYRTHGKWPTSPKRTVAFTVQSVANGQVVEQLSELEPKSIPDVQSARSQPGEASFANWTSVGSEFAPWLAATANWQSGASWKGVRTPAMGEWGDWYTRGEITGREQVTVPAGSYSAWKAEVWSSRRSTASSTVASVEPVRVQYLMWYDPAVKRYVKMVRRVKAADGSDMEEDVFELVAHRRP